MASRPPVLVLLAALLAVMVYQLCDERERRKTVIAVIDRAPGGTVVLVQGHLERPAMRVHVGTGPRLPPRGGRE